MKRCWEKGALLLVLSGCDAEFVDERPDQGFFGSFDAGLTDTGTTARDGGLIESGVFATGPVSGRGGYDGSGTIELVRSADGTVQLQFGGDFSVASVPGPVVVLTVRGSIGSSIQPAAGDVELGVLQSVSGAQSYVVPGGDGGRRYAWVYCKPFGVEVARAELQDVP